MNLAEIAYEAARILSERGLAKGWLMDSEKRVCNNGALLLALGVPEEYLARDSTAVLLSDNAGEWDKLQETERVLLGVNGIFVRHVSEYSDFPSTSAEDVILLLKETGKRLEEAC